MNRYEVRDGSQSAHCCFQATVVDTATPLFILDGVQRYDPICECWTREDAEKIAAALNAAQSGVSRGSTASLDDQDPNVVEAFERSGPRAQP